MAMQVQVIQVSTVVVVDPHRMVVLVGLVGPGQAMDHLEIVRALVEVERADRLPCNETETAVAWELEVVVPVAIRHEHIAQEN